MGMMRNAHKMMVEIHGMKKPCGRPRHRTDDSIKKDLKTDSSDL
jgi:hypothetical protein